MPLDIKTLTANNLRNQLVISKKTILSEFVDFVLLMKFRMSSHFYSIVKKNKKKTSTNVRRIRPVLTLGFWAAKRIIVIDFHCMRHQSIAG